MPSCFTVPKPFLNLNPCSDRTLTLSNIIDCMKELLKIVNFKKPSLEFRLSTEEEFHAKDLVERLVGFE